MTASQSTPTTGFEAQPVQLRSTWLRATLGAMLVLIGVLAVRLLTVTPSETADFRPTATEASGLAASSAARPALPLLPASATR